MASKSSALKTTVLLILIITMSQCYAAGKMALYWGQYTTGGTLSDVCKTGLYEIINVAYLYTFGNGSTPEMLIAPPYCGNTMHDCQGLSQDIMDCQSQGVKIMLSIGISGATLSDQFSLASAQDAKEVAKYLWDSFLSGNSASGRLLGDAVLDGIDFHVGYVASEYWDDLAVALDGYRNESNKLFLLSASTRCTFPNTTIKGALETGVFDYVWVQFFNEDSCEYSSGVDAVKAAWSKWALSVPNAKVFVGVPSSLPSEMAFTKGSYFPPDVLFTQVLPFAKLSPNYGGLMIYFTTAQDGYSLAIKPYV